MLTPNEQSLSASKLKRLKIKNIISETEIQLGTETKKSSKYGIIALSIMGLLILVFIMSLTLLENTSLSVPGGLAALLVGIGFYITKRLNLRESNNSSTKHFKKGQIQIIENNEHYSISSDEALNYEVSITQNGDQYMEGELLLNLKDQSQFALMKVQADVEKYILDDLTWFAQIFNKTTQFDLPIEHHKTITNNII